MTKTLGCLPITILLMGAQAMAASGLITIKSSKGPKETMARLEEQVRARGLTVFADIDHQAGAVAAGLTLRSTRLLIFGNAKGGTPLMQSVQAAGIDLPLKALVWQDAEGITWLSYNAPDWVADRHGVAEPANAAVQKMAGLLNEIAKTATSQ
jgi:uncharacterized protein (DUF302 family)